MRQLKHDLTDAVQRFHFATAMARTGAVTIARRAALAGLLFALIAAAAADDLVISNVTVISPERVSPAAHQFVRVVDGRIVEIADKPLATNATRNIDGSGKYLTPGLIDSHVHLYHATGLKRRYSSEFASLYDGYMTQMPRSYLFHGYTDLIELNTDYDTSRRVATAALRPDIHHCGQGLVLSDDFMSTEFDRAEDFLRAFPNFLHDRYRTPKLPAGFDPAEHTPAATVARIAREGGRCVKLYYEEALWWPGERPAFALPSEAIVREVVSEAHRRRMTVLLHGTTPNAQRLALATGVDVLAHGLWEWPGSRLEETEPPAAITALTDAVADSTLQLQPTMQTLRNEISLTRPDFLDQPELARVLPPAYLRYLRTEAQVQKQELLRRTERVAPMLFPELDMLHLDLPALQRQYIGRYEKLIGRFQRRGGRLLFGTDTAVGGLGWGNPPGLNGLWEMRAWQQAGVSLSTILHAATLGNAKAFGLDAELGTVTVGKRANLLLLNANPLASVEAWGQIDTVILHGKPVDRQTLAADAASIAPRLSAISLPAQAQSDKTAEDPVAEKAAKAARAREEAAEKFRAGFARLRFIEGTWKQAKGTATSAGTEPLFKIAPYLGGKYLETHGSLGAAEFQMIFSYYQPGDHYLMSIVDDRSGVLDVYKGEFDTDGVLVFTNPQFFRISLVPTPGGNFTWVSASSRDQGATFRVTTTYVLEKVP